eukprot:GCRY01003039.1.p1 GENE.GCRY01003039.1~~GCRY01003039.1.p1  ORF type:complete len:657 (+),score=188.21 GCRY01003039.1:119-2089(+)
MASNEYEIEFEKIRVIGRGTFGSAILCRRRSDNRMCVVKQVDLTGMDEDGRNGAINEVRFMSMLKHPCIVAYYDAFFDSGRTILHIVMEFCDSGNVLKLIKKHQLLKQSIPEKRIVHYIVQGLLALKHCHDKKLIHRDIKSENLFLNKKDRCLLGDFGLGRVLEYSDEMASTRVGTPFYLPPEICEGQKYNQKCDIWSMGVVLYELMALEKPFFGTSLPEVIMKITKGKFKPLPKTYCKELRELVGKMLNVKPEKRPSVDEILALEVFRPVIEDIISNSIALDPKELPTDLLTLLKVDLAKARDLEEEEYQRDVFECHQWGCGQTRPRTIDALKDRDLQFVDCGTNIAAAITRDGRVYVWGLMTAVGESMCSKKPQLVMALEDRRAVQVSCGRNFTLILLDTGDVFSVEVSDPQSPIALPELNGLDVVQVAAGGDFFAARTNGGRVYTWGEGADGALGLGDDDSRELPTLVESLQSKKIIDISCGMEHMAAVCENGTVYHWGNLYGEDDQCLLPVQKKIPPGASRPVGVSCGYEYTLVRTVSGQVLSYGNNNCGQLGTGSTERVRARTTPKPITDLPLTITYVVAGASHALAISKTGELYVWGSAEFGRLGDGSTKHQNSPKKLSLLDHLQVFHAAAGEYNTICLAVVRKEDLAAA